MSQRVSARRGSSYGNEIGVTMLPRGVRVKHARSRSRNEAGKGWGRLFGGRIRADAPPAVALIQRDVGGKLGQDPAIVAEHVAFAGAASLVERDGMQILSRHVPATTDRQDGAPAERAPRVHADDVCGHDEPPPGQPPLRLAECGALNTLDADWGGKVQSRVVLLTRFTVVPHPVTARRAAHHVRAQDHEGLTPAASFF